MERKITFPYTPFKERIEGGPPRPRLRAHCECGFTDHIQGKRNMPPEFVERKFREDGWDLRGGKPVCPQCVAARRDPGAGHAPPQLLAGAALQIPTAMCVGITVNTSRNGFGLTTGIPQDLARTLPPRVTVRLCQDRGLRLDFAADGELKVSFQENREWCQIQAVESSSFDYAQFRISARRHLHSATLVGTTVTTDAPLPAEYFPPPYGPVVETPTPQFDLPAPPAADETQPAPFCMEDGTAAKAMLNDWLDDAETHGRDVALSIGEDGRLRLSVTQRVDL